jgi:putative acetyltransferase
MIDTIGRQEMGTVTVTETASTDADLIGLIDTHAQYCAKHTPSGSGHAVATNASNLTTIRYWTAYLGRQAVGCIGLSQINHTHAEIKTMHVLSSARGGGIGITLINRLLAEAKSSGFDRVSLETGRSDGFAASRALYKKAGFIPCEPFGDYADDPFSYCMTMQL